MTEVGTERTSSSRLSYKSPKFRHFGTRIYPQNLGKYQTGAQKEERVEKWTIVS
jgi:hypothetical protein